MKVSVFSGRLDQGKDNRKKAIIEAARKASGDGSSLLILPGWSILEINSKLEELDEISKKYKIRILGEVAKTKRKEKVAFFLFRPDKNPLGPYIQIFSTSNEADDSVNLIKILLSNLRTGNRCFTINNKKFCLLICGENNVIKNIQADHNRPKVRHNFSFPQNYDIIINPSHTTMGNWGKLHQRFSFLSGGNKYLIYTTNNTVSISWKTAICIYFNGKHILSGEKKLEKSIDANYEINNNWRMVTFGLSQ